MLWERVSLLTKVTREPGDTVTCVALTPDELMVMVVASGDGDVEPPPQAVSSKQSAAHAGRRTRQLSPIAENR